MDFSNSQNLGDPDKAQRKRGWWGRGEAMTQGSTVTIAKAVSGFIESLKEIQMHLEN